MARGFITANQTKSEETKVYKGGGGVIQLSGQLVSQFKHLHLYSWQSYLKSIVEYAECNSLRLCTPNLEGCYLFIHCVMLRPSPPTSQVLGHDDLNELSVTITSIGIEKSLYPGLYPKITE